MPAHCGQIITSDSANSRVTASSIDITSPSACVYTAGSGCQRVRELQVMETTSPAGSKISVRSTP